MLGSSFSISHSLSSTHFDYTQNINLRCVCESFSLFFFFSCLCFYFVQIFILIMIFANQVFINDRDGCVFFLVFSCWRCPWVFGAFICVIFRFFFFPHRKRQFDKMEKKKWRDKRNIEQGHTHLPISVKFHYLSCHFLFFAFKCWFRLIL